MFALMERLARMTGPQPHDDRSLPAGYPDLEKVGWIRESDIEFAGLALRLTINPGERTVQVWELEEGHPIQWLGNAFRLDSEPPGLYLNYKYEQRLTRPQRDALAHLAAKFWKS